MNRPVRVRGKGEPQPLEVTLDPTAIAFAAFTDVWQRLVDGLSEQIALLDENWTILAVNQSWARQAALYGPTAFMPGASYMESARDMIAAHGLQIGTDVVNGMEEIAAGKRRSFRIVYRSMQPEADHDHELCIRRFKTGGRTFASVTRYDVTGKVELRALRKDFSRSMMLGQADERRRIGREIHDSTMQLITCLELKMAVLDRVAADDFKSTLDDMHELVSETRQAIQAISYLTHPPLLENVTLPEALEVLAKGFARRTGLDVTFEMAGEEWDDTAMVHPVIGEAAYRIVQEGLSNVQRHSKASHVVVRLMRRKQHVHVVVADDGTGMPDVVTSGVGLAGMHSRLAELGGRLSIQSGRPGTTIIASMPAPLAAIAVPA